MKNLNILLVESNNTSDHVFFDKLFNSNHKSNFNISVAKSIEEAKNIITKYPIDAIVYHAVEDNQINCISSDLPVVVTRIKGNENIVFRFLRSGLDDFIDIPENPIGSLPVVIEKAIKHKKNELNIIRLAAIVESSDDAIFSRSREGVILTWNPGAIKLFGYSEEEAIGQNLSIITSPEQAGEVAQIMESVLNGQPVHNLETKRKRKDGTFVNVSVSVAPMRDTSGHITGLSNIIRDLTGKKESEVKEKMLASIVESTDYAIASYTLDGIILSWNRGAENVFEYTGEEMLGKHISILSPPDRKGEIMGFLHKVADGERIKDVETICVKKNGKPISVSLTISLVRDSIGNVVAVSGIAHDITQRIKLEQYQSSLRKQLEKKNQELNHFVYLASHDLKTPLRAIASVSYWLVQDYGDKLDETGKKNLSFLVGRASRLDKLIDAILHYTNINTELVELDMITLNSFVHELIENLNVPSNINIEVGLLPELVFNMDQMDQVFTHLIKNAIESIDRPGGQIKIGCEEEDGHFKFYVADNGCGIEQKYFSKIFQVFQSLTSRDQKERVGIGLSVVKKIIEGNGGKVWIDSEPGKGTTIFFELSKRFAKLPENKPII